MDHITTFIQVIYMEGGMHLDESYDKIMNMMVWGGVRIIVLVRTNLGLTRASGLMKLYMESDTNQMQSIMLICKIN